MDRWVLQVSNRKGKRSSPWKGVMKRGGRGLSTVCKKCPSMGAGKVRDAVTWARLFFSGLTTLWAQVFEKASFTVRLRLGPTQK